MNINMITAKEAAEKWGVTPRRVQDLCKRGEIKGASQFQRVWMVPADAEYPDKKKAKEMAEQDQPLPRKTPFLYMTNLYSVPGSANEVAESLSYNHEAQVLFEAEVAYSRGEIDKVYDYANYLLKKHSGFYAIISAGMLLALCAIWKGDIEMWRKAKVHIAEAKAKDDREREIITLAITSVDCMLYDVASFPDWFKIGCFEPLHPDAMPAAKVFYAKYLYAGVYAIATKQTHIEGVQGLALMGLLPSTVEPMISWAIADKTLVSEIYLRMTCAVMYRVSGNDKEACRHIDRALALALPDRLYGLIAEYVRTLGPLLEQRVCLVDPNIWNKVNDLYQIYNEGWTKLRGAVIGRELLTGLSQRQREIFRLAALGMKNHEIAKKLNLSVASVKHDFEIFFEEHDIDREELAAYL